MADMVQKFGSFLNSRMETDPASARRLLTAAFRAKRLQLKFFPDKRLSPARRELALYSMDAVLNPLLHPEREALVSIFTPCELLQTFGYAPMMAEAVSCYINGARAERGFIDYAQENGLPETFCSYHKTLLGGMLSGVLPRPKVIVNTSLACDANNLTFRMAAREFQVPQFYIDVPYEVSEDSVQYVTDELKELAGFLEEDAGKKLDMDLLKQHVACAGRTMKKFASCQQAKRDVWLSNDMTDELYEIFANKVLLGMPQIERFADHLLRDLKKAEKTRGIRLLWMHTIPYNLTPLRTLMNFSDRVQIVACDMNYDEFCRTDPEKPFESMARRLVYDSFNGPAERRIKRSIAMAKKLKADGVVYFCHWGCKQTMASSNLAAQMLEEAGFPALVLDGDGVDTTSSSNGQLMTRIEAFVEMLEQSDKENGGT